MKGRCRSMVFVVRLSWCCCRGRCVGGGRVSVEIWLVKRLGEGGSRRKQGGVYEDIPIEEGEIIVVGR